MTDQPDSSAPKAVSSPLLDVLCCGGLSIIALVAFDIWYENGLKEQIGGLAIPSLPLVVTLSILLNFPHFIASYLVLYSDRTQIREHRWASIYVPSILVGLLAVAYVVPTEATSTSTFNEYIYMAFYAVSTVYLAWHYTGQSWGLTVAFAHLGGIEINKKERSLIRLGYRMMLAFHVSFWMRGLEDFVPSHSGTLADLNKAMLILMLMTIPFGIAGFVSIKRRTGITPPLRSILPWAATYVWYGLIYRHPEAFMLVQLSHAAQYLIFPMRVCVNRYAERTRASTLRRSVRLVSLYGLLVMLGWVVFRVPYRFNGELALMIASIVNIHHYFTDGVIWKMRNPKVQKALFWHLSARAAS